MVYKILADFVVLVHFSWIVFLIAGVLLGRRYRTIRIFHMAGLGFAVLLQIFGWYCPLTYLEIWLREKHDPSITYKGSFIIHYVEKLVYINLTREMVFVLTLILVSTSAYLYLKRRK
jgi:Protein of Unknown function (DUF2784)